MILVPCGGFDSTEKLPCTRCIRFCILSSPNHRFFFASSTSKPAPASLTTSRTASSMPDCSMANRLIPLYLTAFCSVSCATRKSVGETSFGKSSGTFLSENSISTWCCLEHLDSDDRQIGSSLYVARRLKIEGSKTRIVFLSVATDIDQVTACFAAGGDAYVSKTSILTDLIYAINEVLAGRTFVSAEISFS
jgi:hypothetical protein